MALQIHSHLDRIKNAITPTRHIHISQSQVTPIDSEDALNILASERRRLTIKYLANRPVDEPVPVSDIAEYIAADENDRTIDALQSKQHKRVYISLYQQQLSAMSNVIDYDDDRGVVTPTPAVNQIWTAFEEFESALSN